MHETQTWEGFLSSIPVYRWAFVLATFAVCCKIAIDSFTALAQPSAERRGVISREFARFAAQCVFTFVITSVAFVTAHYGLVRLAAWLEAGTTSNAAGVRPVAPASADCGAPNQRCCELAKKGAALLGRCDRGYVCDQNFVCTSCGALHEPCCLPTSGASSTKRTLVEATCNAGLQCDRDTATTNGTCRSRAEQVREHSRKR